MGRSKVSIQRIVTYVSPLKHLQPGSEWNQASSVLFKSGSSDQDEFQMMYDQLINRFPTYYGGVAGFCPLNSYKPSNQELQKRTIKCSRTIFTDRDYWFQSQMQCLSDYPLHIYVSLFRTYLQWVLTPWPEHLYYLEARLEQLEGSELTTSYNYRLSCRHVQWLLCSCSIHLFSASTGGLTGAVSMACYGWGQWSSPWKQRLGWRNYTITWSDPVIQTWLISIVTPYQLKDLTYFFWIFWAKISHCSSDHHHDIPRHMLENYTCMHACDEH